MAFGSKGQGQGQGLDAGAQVLAYSAIRDDAQPPGS